MSHWLRGAPSRSGPLQLPPPMRDHAPRHSHARTCAAIEPPRAHSHPHASQDCNLSLQASSVTTLSLSPSSSGRSHHHLHGCRPSLALACLPACLGVQRTLPLGLTLCCMQSCSPTEPKATWPGPPAVTSQCGPTPPSAVPRKPKSTRLQLGASCRTHPAVDTQQHTCHVMHRLVFPHQPPTPKSAHRHPSHTAHADHLDGKGKKRACCCTTFSKCPSARPAFASWHLLLPVPTPAS